MLNKEEFEILDSYPLHQSINIKDYIIDFVIKNPQNYPITSSLISCVTNNIKNAILRDIYDRQTISKTYDSFMRNLHSYYPLEGCRNFTAAMIIFDYEFENVKEHFSKFTILKKINDGRDFIILCTTDILNQFYIFDTNFDIGLICINNNYYYSFMIEVLKNTINFDDLPFDCYKFPTKLLIDDLRTKEDYFRRYKKMMNYITGLKFMKGKKESDFALSQVKNPDDSLFCLMRHNNNSYYKNEYIDQYFVKAKEKSNHILNHPEFINSDPLFDKRIATEYTV